MAQVADVDILLFQNLSNYKQERANDSDFSERLASGIDIFVNDSISLAHKILASTVGVTQFCYASLAGFYFEDCLYKLKKITVCSRPTYVAVIGGDNLIDKAAAVRFLTSICDGLVFVGMMAFQIMHALGVHLPSYLVDHGASKAAVEILQFAKHRKIPVLLPRDFRCENFSNSMQLETFPAHDILDVLL
uniref:Phosphoglycerate kinase n=2 Tax=Opuntia streptacantha TaxID=393608 RepID=A0A7C9DN36_OPUST